MTLDPLLLKSYEFCAHLKKGGEVGYFNPEGATYKPWTIEKKVPEGLALITLKQINRELPSLKQFVLRTEDFIVKHNPRLQELCTTVVHIRVRCKEKLGEVPNKLCRVIYTLRVNFVFTKIIKTVNELSLIDIAHKVDELLPLLQDFKEAKIMKQALQAIEPAIKGNALTQKILATFLNEKSCIKSKVSLLKVLWRMKEIIQEFLAAKMEETLLKSLVKRKEATMKRFAFHIVKHPSLLVEGVSFKIMAKKIQFEFLHDKYVYKERWNRFRKMISKIF